MASSFPHIAKRKNLLIVLSLVVYPAWFLGLHSIANTNSVLVGSRNSDVFGTVRLSQILNGMAFPWSQSKLLIPNFGEHFWDATKIVQLVHWIVFWLLNKFLNPILSVEFFIAFGWIASAVSVYMLARRLGCNFIGSYSAALLFEILPWVRLKAGTHVSYVFVGLPIFLILLLFDFHRNRSLNRFFWLCSYLALTFFFDLYWFYFCASIMVIYLLFEIRYIYDVFALMSFLKKLLIVSLGIFSLSALFLLLSLVRWKLSSNPTSLRNLDVWSMDYINQFQSGPLSLIRPTTYHLFFKPNPQKFVSYEDTIQYVGVVLLVTSIIGCSIGIKILNRDRRWLLFFLIFVSVFFFVISLPSPVFMFDREFVTPINWYRHITPGIRVFSRGSLISQSVLCILFGYCVSVLTKKFCNKRFLKFFPHLIVLIALIDLNPLGGRNLNVDYDKFVDIRNALSSSEINSVFLLQPETDPNHFPPHITNSRQIDLQTVLNRDSGVWASAAEGECAFADWLLVNGLSHVLVPGSDKNEAQYSRKWGEFPSVSLNFDTECFSLEANANYKGFASLYRVLGQVDSGKVFRDVMIDWQGVRERFYKPVYDDGIRFEDGIGVSWVVEGENPKFSVSNKSATTQSYQVEVGLAAAFGQSAQPQIVRITHGGHTQTLKLMAGDPLYVTINVVSSEVITLKNFLPCTVPSIVDNNSTDTRKLCFGITEVKVKSIVP